MTAQEAMQRIDALVTHVWMVRTFIKHSEEVEDDPELSEIQRTLYDYMLALGSAWQAQDGEAYVKQARKKFNKLKRAMEEFAEIQPEVSTHMNFKMAVASLRLAVEEIGTVLDGEVE